MFAITRRAPFDRTFSELMDWIANEPLLAAPGFASGEEGNLALDIAEGDGELVVKASMPGFQKKDIDIQIHNGVLSIKAEHTEEKEIKEEKYYRRERRVGAVSRRIALPGVVSDANAKAELKDGILTVRIPQAEVARPKQIAVN